MSNQKVSIVVPIYNAEQYLGYTISSIIKQTYKNIEIILVNDGSEDDSLQICRNYAEIDARIKVVDIPNGGVSKARNKGIAATSGTYVQFVDSDDVIAETMTERLVAAMETYETDMVVCGMRYVLLDGKQVLGTEDWLPSYLERKCVLSQRMFLEDFSGILLHTVLLEGPCNKLYKREYLEKYDIRFPVDKDLGEDFLLNLQYFRKMKRIVFISDVLYYYLQWSKESLTQCYRSNMYDNHLCLLEEYEKFLQEQDVWKYENIRFFNRYAVGYIIRCLKALLDERNVLSETEIKAELYRMLSNEKSATWIQQVDWIPEEYEWLKVCVNNRDIGLAYEKLAELRERARWIKENERNENAAIRYYPGKINRVISYTLQKINAVLKNERIKKTIESLEQYGIKVTMAKIRISCRYRMSKVFSNDKAE